MRRTQNLAWVALAALALTPGYPPPSAAQPSARGGDGPRSGAPGPGPATNEPEGDLSLREALALTLQHHPALASDSWEVRAREAEVQQAGRRPNPELQLELENIAGTGSFGGLASAEATLAVSHVLELGGKRAKRLRSAQLDRDLAAWDYELRRIDVATETAILFAEVLAAQERLAVADTLLGVAEQVLTSVSRRVEAGGISPVEERRARVALETDRVDRERNARELDVARMRLAALWGRRTAVFERAVGELRNVAPAPSLDDLSAQLASNPDLARWATELDRRRAARAEARSGRIPDLTVSGGVRHFRESDDNALLLGVSVPLPLFDRNRGTTEAADGRIAQGEAREREAAVRLSADLVETHAVLVMTSSEAAALRDRILPEASAAFSDATEAYQRGRLRLTDVLDTERTYFELRGRYIDVLARYHGAVARIERLLGSPLPGAPVKEDG